MNLQYEHLLGRAYVPGVAHCYSLVRDFYRDNFALELGNYPVPHDWDADRVNLIEKIHEREGFEKLQDWSIKSLRPGDALCVAIRASNPNHFAVYVGENKLIHHPLLQLSREEPWRDFWRMTTCYVLRHPAVPVLTSALPETTIKDLVSARYSPQAEA